MDVIKQVVDWFIQFILHMDKQLDLIVKSMGLWSYAILFVVIFIETGLVITPFLPGDSLLFAAGSLAAIGSFNVWGLYVLLALAAILGDTANYWIGHFLGQRAYSIRWIKKEYLERTHAFFEKHGRTDMPASGQVIHGRVVFSRAQHHKRIQAAGLHESIYVRFHRVPLFA